MIHVSYSLLVVRQLLGCWGGMELCLCAYLRKTLGAEQCFGAVQEGAGGLSGWHPPPCSSSLFGSRSFAGTSSRGNEKQQQRGSLHDSVKQIQVLDLKNLASPESAVSMVNFPFCVTDFSFHYV